MDPASVDGLRATTDPAFDADGRVPHGSDDDRSVLDFSANTNPVVPDGVRRVYADAFETARRYPDDEYPAFRRAGAAFLDCSPDGIVPTAGGLEAIRLAIQTTVAPGETVLLPRPSFGEYAREVRLQGAEPVFADHLTIPETDPAPHSLVVVCNPNNPTGECADADALRELAAACRDAGTTLLVDEAFLGFTEEPTLAGTDGVVVARSLTKLFGLPGVRMGYAVATGSALDRLRTARRAWSMSAAAAAVGAYCYRQREFVAATRARVASERERMRNRLASRFEVAPSDAPFLLLGVTDTSVETVLEDARERGLALRDARTFRGLESHVRVAVRTASENDKLLEALDV